MVENADGNADANNGNAVCSRSFSSGEPEIAETEERPNTIVNPAMLIFARQAILHEHVLRLPVIFSFPTAYAWLHTVVGDLFLSKTRPPLSI